MERVAQITCEFCFESSHQLRREEWSDAENEAVFGNCARLHGHSYRLLVTIRGPIDPYTGMVRNFRDVKQLVREQVVARLDHHHLDPVVGALTTAENLCYWIAAQLLPGLGAGLYRVELWETRSAFAALTESELAVLRHSLGPPCVASLLKTRLRATPPFTRRGRGLRERRHSADLQRT